jgi:3-isopropylmalate dehydrogenase
MRLDIVLLPGDGIGPEVVAGAQQVLDAVARRFGHELRIRSAPIGWAAVQESGVPLPDPTLRACRESPAVLLGAVGDPRADGRDPAQRPEVGLLALRRALGCYANLRPARVEAALLDASPLRPELARGVDLLIVRELAGGIYYGEPRSPGGSDSPAVNTMSYGEAEVRRIARTAFELARTRRRRIVSIDKANVLEVSRLWRRVVTAESALHPDIELSHMLVDRAAMELVRAPAQFDVILTANLFGDVLSDEAAGITGSIGLLGSASLGGATGLYEPVHGSAPELAGQNTANPAGTIASAALMLRHSFDLEAEAASVEAALTAALADGLCTPDLARGDRTVVGTREFAADVARRVLEGEPRGEAGA